MKAPLAEIVYDKHALLPFEKIYTFWRTYEVHRLAHSMAGKYIRPSVKVRTYERYRLIIEQHVKDKIGGIELNEDNLSNSLSGYFSLSSETIIAFCFLRFLPL